MNRLNENGAIPLTGSGWSGVWTVGRAIFWLDRVDEGWSEVLGSGLVGWSGEKWGLDSQAYCLHWRSALLFGEAAWWSMQVLTKKHTYFNYFQQGSVMCLI